MSTEKLKAPPPSRSLIPVPKTYSLQRSQTQSTENVSNLAPKYTIKSPAISRRMTRHSSVSRLPISRITTNGKSCPQMVRSISAFINSKSDWNSYQPNSKVSPKLFKPKESHNSCQRYLRNHNPSQSHSKPAASFKIYNKFSPYYENESLDSQTSDTINSNQRQNNSDLDCISSISSTAEEPVNGTRIVIKDRFQNGMATAHNQQMIDSGQPIIYRTQSVPEHIQQNNRKINECLDKVSIEKLKKRLLESIDNEEEEEQDLGEDMDDEQPDYEVPQNIEIRLLRMVIRHLKEKISQLKDNLDQMTQQSTANKQMCEAFQKSLSAMTIRAQNLTQDLDIKQTELDRLNKQLKERDLDYDDLDRKYQQLDSEYKKLNTNLINNNLVINNNENNCRTDSSMSTMSYGDSCTEGSTRVKIRATSSWLRGSTLSKAFKRRKKLNIFSNSSSDLLSTTKVESTTKSVCHLKDLIREKELTINDLKLESLATTNRMEKLEDDLKTSREESNNLKKNKEILEKMIKMKIIE